ncbi:MAG: ATP-binding cassette domain-containing protein [Leptolyngbya sp. Prado105]|jgi:D-methionine transport system ATP-binding protein|nr:ATP-binding cassette domain-containing protein [Leptolyngbya sp. Prado105]
MLLKVEQVSFALGRVSKKGGSLGAYELLRNLSFEVNKGARVAIVGASGAGKTTLLRLLNRLAEPSQGWIEFEGKRFQEIPVLKLRQQIVFVAQEPKLFGMTVREALSYPLQLRNIKNLDRQVNECVERMSIPRDWLDRTEQELSTGEKQWIAIARGLICQPVVLLLDEPIANLDTSRSELLLSILAQVNCTTLAVTHQFEWAERFSHRVLQLERGQLVTDSSSVDWQGVKHAIEQIETEDAEEWD